MLPVRSRNMVDEQVSDRQLEANKANAKLGGVKTAEGKAISKLNAIKHGLLSKEVLLEGEDESQLISLGQRLRSQLAPVGELELILVDRVISSIWRLKRALRVEVGMVEWRSKDYMDRPKTLGETYGEEFTNNDGFGKYMRYETAIERSLYKALHELQRTQSARAGNKPPAPLAIDLDISS